MCNNTILVDILHSVHSQKCVICVQLVVINICTSTEYLCGGRGSYACVWLGEDAIKLIVWLLF